MLYTFLGSPSEEGINNAQLSNLEVHLEVDSHVHSVNVEQLTTLELTPTSFQSPPNQHQLHRLKNPIVQIKGGMLLTRKFPWLTLNFIYFLVFLLGCGNSRILALIVAACHNPNLGLMTKARACKVASQKGSSEVTSCVPESAKKCEGVNLHTPKWTPIVRVGVPNGLLNLQRAIGVKTHFI